MRFCEGFGYPVRNQVICVSHGNATNQIASFCDIYWNIQHLTMPWPIRMQESRFGLNSIWPICLHWTLLWWGKRCVNSAFLDFFNASNRELSMQMKTIQLKLTNRINFGKILTLFTMLTTVESGPWFSRCQTPIFRPSTVLLVSWYFCSRSKTYLSVALYKICGVWCPLFVHKSDILLSGYNHEN